MKLSSSLLTSNGLCWWPLLLLTAVGCSNAPSMGEVHGIVTLDKQPLESGAVQLVPLDGHAPTAGAQIVNGTFQTRAHASKYRVKIDSNIAVRPNGTKVDPDRKIDKYSKADFTIKQLVPDKYNRNSNLELEVKSGLNEPKFDLTSK